MRKQDFINLDEVKFRVSFPEEVVTTQEYIDDFAIEFAEWIDEIRIERRFLYDTSSIKELLEIYKEEL